jgi:toxin ParE1/3/4
VKEYSLSPLAELDLDDIAEYTTDIWGPKQAVKYINALFVCFDRITRDPGLGRRCDPVRPGLRRIEEGKHVVFYKVMKDEVFISRILHQSMLPNLHDILGGGS